MAAKRSLGILTAVALLIVSGAPVHARAPIAAAAAQMVQGADGGWPRAFTTASGAALVVYQPQIVS